MADFAKRSWKRITFQIVSTSIACIIAMAILGYFKYRQVAAAIAEHSNFQMPPEAITAIEVKELPWRDSFSAVGSLAPVQGVTLSSEEAGIIREIRFESGKEVNAGDVLIALDTSVEESQLKSSQARLELARANFKRISQARATNAVPASDLDTATAQEQQMVADVETLRATIARKIIRAPFSGVTGIRMINPGQFVAPGTALVPLHDLKRVYVNFSMPQAALGKISVGMAVEITVDAYPEETFHGSLTTVEPGIDEQTRNVKLQASFDNGQQKLRPGMFVNVSLVAPTVAQLITIPATSISYAPYGDSVFVIEKKKDDKGAEFLGVRQQFVRLGARRGDQIAIVSGLKVGEQIATSGVFKLSPMSHVTIKTDVAPGNEVSPTPADS